MLGLGVVILLSGASDLTASIRYGLIPAGAVIGAILVLRHRDRVANRRRSAELVAAVTEIQAKSQLLAGVAHEIQDPLTGLVGLSELLRDSDTLSATEMREFIELIHNEAADLAMLAEDLYVVSASAYESSDGYRPVAVDLLLEAERASTVLDHLGHTVIVKGEPLVAMASHKRLRHVLRSVMANVDRFGGPTVEVIVEERAGQPTIVISDDGPPLDVEAVATTGAGRGLNRTGRSALRIAIATMMAESFGAKLAYERSPGWCNFILTVPGTQPAQLSSDGRRNPTGTRPTGLG